MVSEDLSIYDAQEALPGLILIVVEYGLGEDKKILDMHIEEIEA